MPGKPLLKSQSGLVELNGGSTYQITFRGAISARVLNIKAKIIPTISGKAL